MFFTGKLLIQVHKTRLYAWCKKCTSLGRLHNLEEFHEFLWSSKIFGVRKILENRQNQPFLAILSHFAAHPTRGPHGGGG